MCVGEVAGVARNGNDCANRFETREADSQRNKMINAETKSGSGRKDCRPNWLVKCGFGMNDGDSLWLNGLIARWADKNKLMTEEVLQ